MTPKSIIAALLALGSVACAAGTTPTAPSSSNLTSSSNVTSGSEASVISAASSSDALLAGVRNATARYHDIDKAIADGYVVPPPSACFEVPGLGAMGVHVFNPQYASDQAIDPLKPEVLLYIPKNGGGMRLVGVEYFVPLSGPLDPTPRPAVFGQDFQGPMAGHEPGMPWHYDLHVWAWEPNPSGTFAQFNPRLSCGSFAEAAE